MDQGACGSADDEVRRLRRRVLVLEQFLSEYQRAVADAAESLAVLSRCQPFPEDYAEWLKSLRL